MAQATNSFSKERLDLKPTRKKDLAEKYPHYYFYIGEGKMARYLVCRIEGIRPHNQINSSLFPIVVQMDCMNGLPSSEEIVRKACSYVNEGYVGMHSYVVVPMEGALVVSFKPRQNYDVEVHKY